MHVPMPLLIAAGVAFALLLVVAFRRRASNDLLAPPRPSVRPAGLSPSPLPAGPSSGLPPEVDAEVRRLMRSGRKVEAIKRVREHEEIGLAEAKDLVERMADEG